eukprot:1648602-Prymnesium_polylepis.3
MADFPSCATVASSACTCTLAPRQPVGSAERRPIRADDGVDRRPQLEPLAAHPNAHARRGPSGRLLLCGPTQPNRPVVAAGHVPHLPAAPCVLRHLVLFRRRPVVVAAKSAACTSGLANAWRGRLRPHRMALSGPPGGVGRRGQRSFRRCHKGAGGLCVPAPRRGRDVNGARAETQRRQQAGCARCKAHRLPLSTLRRLTRMAKAELRPKGRGR